MLRSAKIDSDSFCKILNFYLCAEVCLFANTWKSSYEICCKNAFCCYCSCSTWFTDGVWKKLAWKEYKT